MAANDFTNTTPSVPTPQYEKISSPERIFAHLKKLKSARTQLTVTIPDCKDIYTSILLEVASDQSHLLLDELNVLKGHEQLLNTGKLRAFSNFRGTEMSFACELLQVIEEGGIPAYKLTYPAVLNYRQRRAHYRAPVGHAQAISVQLDYGSGQVLEATLSDISIGGLGVLLQRNDWPDLAVGHPMRRCTFKLPENIDISVQAEVRNFQDREQGQLHLGMRFIDLPKARVRSIEQFVARLDRELIKKGVSR